MPSCSRSWCARTTGASSTTSGGSGVAHLSRLRLPVPRPGRDPGDADRRGGEAGREAEAGPLIDLDDPAALRGVDPERDARCRARARAAVPRGVPDRARDGRAPARARASRPSRSAGWAARPWPATCSPPSLRPGCERRWSWSARPSSPSSAGRTRSWWPPRIRATRPRRSSCSRRPWCAGAASCRSPRGARSPAGRTSSTSGASRCRPARRLGRRSAGRCSRRSAPSSRSAWCRRSRPISTRPSPGWTR